ncbi:MAG TPA: hypothetical protein PLR18_04710 [bacterium]|nr:hypothetical protein [bacterium]
MDQEEVKYLKENFPVDFFNIHATGQHINRVVYGEYKKDIFVENLGDKLPASALGGYGGLCFDVSHMEEQRLSDKQEEYNQMRKILETCKCGVAHISAVNQEKFWHEKIQRYCFSSHTYSKLEEFDYLCRYNKYLPDILALELENTIEEQLKAKEYIEKLLAGKN